MTPATPGAMDELAIGPYADEDREAVVDLWRDVFAGDPPWNDPMDVIDRKLEVQPELFLVGKVGGRLVATIVAGYDGTRGWVHHLAVSPDMRRRGHAGRLMDAVEVRLTAVGCPKLNLQVRGSNAAVIGFYEQRGYSVEDVVSLGKPLSPWTRDAR